MVEERGTGGGPNRPEATAPAGWALGVRPGDPCIARISRRHACAPLRITVVILALTAWVAEAPAWVAESAAAILAVTAWAAEVPAACRCERFAAELAAAEALFASRGDGVETPLTDAMREAFRERVDEAYARARCLADCETVPDRERNGARVLLAFAAFKRAGLSDAVATGRLETALAAAARCLEVEPAHPACHLWHASARGTLARDSWNPLNLRLPGQLLVEFRAARAGAPPGHDLLDGTATRGEVSLLLRAPAIAGGDRAAARRLVEEAAAAPGFTCAVANRLLLATVRARTGAPELALAELRATVAAGLPSCGLQRYENASALEEVSRCLARLEAEPAADPGGDDDCRSHR